MEVATPSKPHPLTPPIDVSRVSKEKDVKTLIKRLLDFHGWFHWMPAANGYGAQGVSDHLAIKDGVFLAVEAKFGSGKPSTLQKAFCAQIMSNSGFAFCVNESNIDHLAWWLESFEIARQQQQEGKQPDSEHGSRLLNAISVLTDAFAQ
jgi:hypothetical protein